MTSAPLLEVEIEALIEILVGVPLDEALQRGVPESATRARADAPPLHPVVGPEPGIPYLETITASWAQHIKWGDP